MTLEECISYALTHNLNIELAALDIEQAGEDLHLYKRQRSPMLTGNIGQGVNFGRSIDPFTNQFIEQRIFTNNMSLSGSLVLYEGRRRTNQVKSGRISYKIREEEKKLAERTLVLEVMENYFSALLYRELIETYRHQKEQNIKTTKINEALLQSGYILAARLKELYATEAADELNISQAENQLNSALLNLKRLLNLPQEEMPELADIPIDTENLVLLAETKLIDEALTTQPDLKVSKLLKEKSALNLKMARGMMLPSLSLNTVAFTGYSSARRLFAYNTFYQQETIGYLSGDPSQTISANVQRREQVPLRYPFLRQLNDNFSQMISLNLTIPILQNGMNLYAVKSAKIEEKRARVNAELQAANLKTMLEQLYAECRTSYKNLQNATEQYEALKEALRVAREKHENGYVSSADFYQANNNFRNVTFELVKSRYSLLFQLKTLEYYQSGKLGL
ncbi:TolC family protein [Cytophagaceae bacterium ABcell3]|nr:TolC family protein [Cytophagaceae bacterium ABcell3]